MTRGGAAGHLPEDMGLVNKKKLVFHIGVHKTGSTSIQQTLAGNSGLLARHGILYPKYPAAAANATNHNRLAWEITTGTVDLVKLRSWARSLAQADAHTVIVSAEDCCKLKDLAFMRCFGEFFEPEIVIYVRRQDAWVGSWYNQNVKWPYVRELARCTPNEFLGHLRDFHWINYFETAERWAKEVGRDKIRIRVFESGQIEDPVADLCDICGVDFVLEKALQKRANESFPATQLRILQDINIMQYTPDVRLKIIDAVSRIPVTSRDDIYPAPIRRMILDRYAAGNAMVAEHYLGRKDQVLFREQDIPDSTVYRENALDDENLYCFARNLIDVFRANATQISARSDSPPGSPSSAA